MDKLMRSKEAFGRAEKVILGGVDSPVRAFKQDVMEILAPLGDVYQAGTMSGNPVVMAAEQPSPGGYRSLCGVFREIYKQ